MLSPQATVALHNGVKIPILGFGVYLAGNDTIPAIQWALEAGYRHIDTAARYKNEDLVGKAIRESGIPREEIFVTTKCWNTDQRDGTQREAFEASYKALSLEYIDLYLVHWPVKEKQEETWKIMEEIYLSGRVRAIGVSNHLIHNLEQIFSFAKVKPMVNQLEVTPKLTRKDLVAFCRKNGLACVAWGPLGSGKMLDHPVLAAIGEKYGKSAAQVILRWDVQNEIIPIPKSVNPNRIRANADIFDFALSNEDMAAIDALDENILSYDPENPPM